MRQSLYKFALMIFILQALVDVTNSLSKQINTDSTFPKITHNFNNAHDTRDNNVYDYAILGAGISGLRAASLLLSENKKVIILEAQHKIGGKIISKNVKDIPELNQAYWFNQDLQGYQKDNIELGAAEIDVDHVDLLDLCRKYGLNLTSFETGQTQYMINGQIGDLYLQSVKRKPQIIEFFKKLKVHTKRFDEAIKKVQQNPNDKKSKKIILQYDSKSAMDFISNELGLKDNKFLRQIAFNQLEIMLCVQKQKIGSIGLLTNFEDFKEVLSFYVQKQVPDWHIIGGNNQLPQKIYQEVLSKGGKIRFNHEVLEIDNLDYQKEIIIHTKVVNKHSTNIQKFKAKNVMYAMSQINGKNIKFARLSKTKRIVFDSVLPTTVIKSFLFVEEQIVQDDPQSGTEEVYMDTKSLANIVLNNSYKKKSKDLGIYVFFHSKSRIQKFHKLSKQKRRQYLNNILIKAYELDEEDQKNFDNSVHVEFNVASNKYLQGAYSTIYGMNYYQKIFKAGGNINNLVNDEYGISFITSQFSTVNNGYMEGALQNSKRSVFRKLKEENLKKWKKQRHLIEVQQKSNQDDESDKSDESDD